MPLNDSFPLSVVFVRRHDRDKPGGTAFVVELREDGERFEYLVTAAHNVRKWASETVVRLRRKSGGVDDIDVPQWTCHPDPACDVAVSLLTASHDEYDYRTIPMTAAVHHHEGGKWRLRLGDRVYFIGLLAQVPAMTDGGIPIVRGGTLGAMYQHGIPVEFDKTRWHVYGHLMDCRAYSGFSGSPCFVQREEYKLIRQFDINGVSMQGAGIVIGDTTLLLGLHSAHFPGWDEAKRGDERTDLRVPVNSGVGIITPVEAIEDTLQLEEIVADRKRRIERIKQERREHDEPAVSDSADDDEPRQPSRGPTPERLRIDRDWRDAVSDALKKKPPEGGWPER